MNDKFKPRVGSTANTKPEALNGAGLGPVAGRTAAYATQEERQAAEQRHAEAQFDTHVEHVLAQLRQAEQVVSNSRMLGLQLAATAINSGVIAFAPGDEPRTTDDPHSRVIRETRSKQHNDVRAYFDLAARITAYVVTGDPDGDVNRHNIQGEHLREEAIALVRASMN